MNGDAQATMLGYLWIGLALGVLVWPLVRRALGGVVLRGQRRTSRTASPSGRRADPGQGRKGKEHGGSSLSSPVVRSTYAPGGAEGGYSSFPADGCRPARTYSRKGTPKC